MKMHSCAASAAVRTAPSIQLSLTIAKSLITTMLPASSSEQRMMSAIASAALCTTYFFTTFAAKIRTWPLPRCPTLSIEADQFRLSAKTLSATCKLSKVTNSVPQLVRVPHQFTRITGPVASQNKRNPVQTPRVPNELSLPRHRLQTSPTQRRLSVLVPRLVRQVWRSRTATTRGVFQHTGRWRVLCGGLRLRAKRVNSLRVPETRGLSQAVPRERRVTAGRCVSKL